MRKKNFNDLAICGILVGLSLSGCSSQAQTQMTPQQQAFYEMLDPEAKEQFLELDSEHREAATSITEQYCKAAHECRGLREKSVRKQYELQKQENQ